MFFYPSTELTSSIHALRNGDSTMNPSNELHWIDYLIIRIYFVFVLGIGFVPVNSRLAWSHSNFEYPTGVRGRDRSHARSQLPTCQLPCYRVER